MSRISNRTGSPLTMASCLYRFSVYIVCRDKNIVKEIPSFEASSSRRVVRICKHSRVYTESAATSLASKPLNKAPNLSLFLYRETFFLLPPSLSMYTRGNQSTIYCLYIRKTSGLYRHRDLKPCVFGLHFRREDAGKAYWWWKEKDFKKEKKSKVYLPEWWSYSPM